LYEAVPVGERRMREANVSFPDARNAVQEKRNYFPELMSGVHMRARIFEGPGGVMIRERRRVRIGTARKEEIETLVESNYSHDGYGYPRFAR